MESPLIIANWKSNLLQKDATLWLETMRDTLSNTKKQVVVCPSFTLLSFFSQNQIPNLSVGAQDISPYDKGAYTGEINGEQIREFAQYVIIGHSERRNFFKEDDEMLSKKVNMARTIGVIPIYCIQGEDTFVPQGVEIVAYEPVWAIGSGKSESPEEANKVAKAVKQKTDVKIVLYGGSVTGENVRSFTLMSDLHGVLVGGASLDPQKFSQIILNA